MPKFNYEYITPTERLNILQDRLAQLERDYFNADVNRIAAGDDGATPGSAYFASLEHQQKAILDLRAERDTLSAEIDKDNS